MIKRREQEGKKERGKGDKHVRNRREKEQKTVRNRRDNDRKKERNIVEQWREGTRGTGRENMRENGEKQ